MNTIVPFRIDHCHFTYLAHSPMVAIYGANLGVADHNVFDHFTGTDRFRYTLGERMAARVLLDDPRWFCLHGTGVFYRQQVTQGAGR